MQSVRTIMLVDDDPITNLLNRQYIRLFSPEIVVSVFLAATDAVAELRQMDKCPDLIFLDINMPEMDGWEFLDELMRLQIDCRVMMLSSSIDVKDIDRSLQYSLVKKFISKPLTNTELSEIL